MRLYFHINPSLSQGCKPNPSVSVDVSTFPFPTYFFPHQEPTGITGVSSTRASTWWASRPRATPPPPRPARWATTWGPPAATSPSPRPTWPGSRRSWGSLGSSPSACRRAGCGSGRGGGSGGRAQPWLCFSQPACSRSESYIAHLFMPFSLHFLLVELDGCWVGLGGFSFLVGKIKIRNDVQVKP